MFASLNARALGLTLTPEETVELAAREGFGGVDILVRDLVDQGGDARLLRRRIDDAGLKPGAFPLPITWRCSAEPFAQEIDRLPRYAEAAATLGLLRTGTWVLPETWAAGLEPMGQEETRRFHLERLGEVARTLEPFGIRLGIEVIGVLSARTGRGDPFVQRLADLDARLEGVWALAPNLGILVDGFHLFAAGEPPEQGLAWGVDRVTWVHVADLPPSTPRDVDRAAIRDHDRGLPGEFPGVQTRRLLQLLADAGYDGPVTAEPMAGCRSLGGLDPVSVVRKVKGAVQSVWPEGRPL
ncbi:MAG: sugar phosphate isomerase/epimerase family protein [Isosphaeraceae bacterium]